MKTTLALLALLTLGATPPPARQKPPVFGSQMAEPYRVIGNIYYVGATDVSAHVIATPAGLILLDTGTAPMLPGIRANLEKLGFRIHDIKIILSSHAHWDHVEGHAAMQALTGAQVMAVGEDAAAIASGVDSSAIAAQGWKPVKVDRVLKDGDTVALGGVTMQAHLTPGHTKGCTTWTMTVQDSGRSCLVVFVGGISINPGVKLLGNSRHPSIIEDYARTFRVLKGLKADVFLAQHPEIYGMAEKVQRLKANGSPNPFIDPQGYQRVISDAESRYKKQLAEEQASSR